MAEWLEVDDLRVHMNLPDASVADGSNIETRMHDALNAAMEVIDHRTVTSWDDEDVLPAVVRQAGLIQAARFFKRDAAPLGIATVGTIDGGQGMRLLSRLDPDVEVLLAEYLEDYSTL